MKRMAVVLAAIASLVCFSTGFAADAHHDMGKMSEGKPSVTIGELVDMGCYVGHGAKGEKHADCAAKCIAGGMPIGVLTPAGQLYVLTMDHANPDPYNKAKDMAGKRVKVGGSVHVRNGVKTIDVTSAEVMPAMAAST
jgi:hypothetical protein